MYTFLDTNAKPNLQNVFFFFFKKKNRKKNIKIKVRQNFTIGLLKQAGTQNGGRGQARDRVHQHIIAGTRI
jgi:hypothetical protein